MPVRTRIVNLRKGIKQITIVESTVGELEEMLGAATTDQVDKLIGSNNVGEAKSAIFGLLYDKIPLFIPEISAEDIKKSYMSEVEDVIQAFIDVNFTGIKRLAGPLVKTILNSGSFPPAQ